MHWFDFSMVLISGSQGFIGHHLQKAIPDSIGLDNTDRKKKLPFINVDLLDYNNLFWALKNYGIETILHNAAIPSVPASYNNPIRTYLNNVNGSINLIKAAKVLGVKKFIFASSSSVNGPSPYGHSKKIIEDVLANSGLNFTVLRYFNVFGPGQRENIVKIMIDKLSSNEELTIFGDGKTSRDFSYVDNVFSV